MTNLKKEPHQERSLVIIKPDGVQRGLIGEIVGRFERTGLKLTGLKLFVPTKEQVEKHYNKDDEWFLKKGNLVISELKEHGLPVEKEAMEYGRAIIDTITHYMTAAPVVGFVVEGNQSVAIVQKLVGTTEPSTSDVGTIRGDLTVDSYGHATYEDRAVRNLVHCSESPEEAERELAVWFTEDELQKYQTAAEHILYDVNFDNKPE